MRRSRIGVFVGTVFATWICSYAICAPQSVLSYHGHPDRNGNFIVPSLTWDTARHLHLDEGFHARVPGHVYAQPLFWRALGSASGMLRPKTMLSTRSTRSAVVRSGAMCSASRYPAARYHAETSTRSG